MGHGTWFMGQPGLRLNTSRASATRPVTAAAATMSGLMRRVRPVGLPWRPLKLRLEELAQSWSPTSLSGIHRQAHRAAGLAPLEAGVAEDPVDAERRAEDADALRTGHGDRLHARRDAAALEELRHLLKIAQPPVGARAEEGHVDLRALDRRARRQLHVGQRLLDRGLLVERP